MKAVITGGTGFLGARLALRLAGMGWQVTALGRNKTAGSRLEASANNLRFLPADLRDAMETKHALQGADIVFHCGALSSPWGKYQDFYDSNVRGTEHVVQGCLSHKVKRLIHVSTPSIYFDYRHRLNIQEDDPLPAKSVNHYAATKRLAEEAVLRGISQGQPAIILRPRGIYGPGDTTLIPRLIAANETGGVPMIRSGSALIDLTYVDNVVEALVCGAAAPDSALGLSYNITDGAPATLSDILRKLFVLLGRPLHERKLPYGAAFALASLMELGAKAMGREPQLTRYTVSLLAFSQTLDISRARELLGYVPPVSLNDGLRQVAEWWKEEHPNETRTSR